MTRSFAMAAGAFALLTGACTQSPPPSPDPVALELALAAIESGSGSETAAQFREKIAGADRISSTLAKVAPEKLDPNAAAALLR